LGNLLHIAEDAVLDSYFNDNHAVHGLLQILERARRLIQELHGFIRLHLLKDPASFEDETKEIEIRWNMWIMKEGKLRKLAANMASIRQSIATALTALTTTST